MLPLSLCVIFRYGYAPFAAAIVRTRDAMLGFELQQQSCGGTVVRMNETDDKNECTCKHDD